MYNIIKLSSVLLIAVAISGCQTFMPEGWRNVSTSNVQELSNILADVIVDVNAEDSEELRKCTIESGISGGVYFWKQRKSTDDLNSKVLASVKEADKYAKANYPIIYEKYQGLDGIVLKLILNKIGDRNNSLITVDINRSDVLVALLHVFVDTGRIGNLIDLQSM